jgi:DNA-binding NtrC family response regulator
LLASGEQISIHPDTLASNDLSSGRSLGWSSDWPSGLAFSAAKALMIERFERAFIAQALVASCGNVSQAARICGKERRAFGKLLKRYCIDRVQFVATRSASREHGQDT